jgi:beta-glucosidase
MKNRNEDKIPPDQLNAMPFMNPSLDHEQRIEDLLSRLTMEEKCQLCSGKKMWTTKPVPRLGIPPFGMTDGPNGMAFHSSGLKRNTAFPTSICMGATWDPDLAYDFGLTYARELRALGNRHMTLGPGININRSPLNGRTFEYISEDPFLISKLVVPIVKGIQSQRIVACVKHYACNNQETRRTKIDAVVSERALQEIYLPGFKAAVEEADALSIMACYNKLNGLYGCENPDLLIRRLRNEWGFRGFVVSDWFATRPASGAEGCINGGLSLEMPTVGMYNKLVPSGIISAIREGRIREETLDENVRRLLRAMFFAGLFDDPRTLPEGSRNTQEHAAVAKRIAQEGMVLLKNDNAILPLDINKVKRICVLGRNANRKQALPIIGGSSAVWPKYEITPFCGLKNKLKNRAVFVKNPADADVAVVVVGLNHFFGKDAEGKDRPGLELPEKDIQLIIATARANSNTVVVLVNGSPVAVDPWIGFVPAVLEAWYGGQEAGTVIADILFGDTNPSGKLPLTFPGKISDSPAHASQKSFPGDMKKLKVFYDEGIYVGYRHFDAKNIEPAFPFGFGLSYTDFKYENLALDRTELKGAETLTVKVDITNSGSRAGAEVAQLYIHDVTAGVDRPPKELKGFRRVHLKAGEKRTIDFEITSADLSFFDPRMNAWSAEPGEFIVMVGSSSRDIRLEKNFDYIGEVQK